MKKSNAKKANNAPAVKTKPAATVEKPVPVKAAKKITKTVFGHMIGSARATIDENLLKGITEKACVKLIIAAHPSRNEKSAANLFRVIVKENKAAGHKIEEDKDGVFKATAK